MKLNLTLIITFILPSFFYIISQKITTETEKTILNITRKIISLIKEWKIILWFMTFECGHGKKTRFHFWRASSVVKHLWKPVINVSKCYLFCLQAWFPSNISLDLRIDGNLIWRCELKDENNIVECYDLHEFFFCLASLKIY